STSCADQSRRPAGRRRGARPHGRLDELAASLGGRKKGGFHRDARPGRPPPMLRRGAFSRPPPPLCQQNRGGHAAVRDGRVPGLIFLTGSDSAFGRETPMKLIEIVPHQRVRLYGALVAKEASIRKGGRGTYFSVGRKKADSVRWSHKMYGGSVQLK